MRGRVFAVPVDKGHKAISMPIFTCANPHMRAFHVSWFGFFASFYSTFAAASLNAYMIPDLNLNEGEWALGNTLAICGTIFFRIVMGWICDKFGARRGLGYLLLATSPACVLMMFINSGWQMILLRTIIGFSLACAPFFSHSKTASWISVLVWFLFHVLGYSAAIKTMVSPVSLSLSPPSLSSLCASEIRC